MLSNSAKSLVLALALLPLSALAQDKQAPDSGAPGCGDNNVKFQVKTTAEPNYTPAGPGQALVYLVEEDSNFDSIPKPTTRVGVDGVWIGATHGNSFLVFSVDPGVHHLCASWQSGKSHPSVGLLIGASTGFPDKSSAIRFTAEAGGTYYFQVRDIFFHTESSTKTDMGLAPLDSDQGQLLVSKYARSESHPKLVYSKTE